MGFFDFLTGGKNPADAASPYLDRIPGELQKYLDPYINRGNSAYDKFNPQLNDMTSDPAAFLEKISKDYQPSRSYQLKRDEALRAAGNSAAAGGMRGSLQDIEGESRLTDALMGEDMQQWLNNVLGIQGRGIQGQQHLYDTGYDASKGLSGDLANILGTQAQLAFQGQNQKNQNMNDIFSAFTNFAGAIPWSKIFS